MEKLLVFLEKQPKYHKELFLRIAFSTDQFDCLIKILKSYTEEFKNSFYSRLELTESYREWFEESVKNLEPLSNETKIEAFEKVAAIFAQFQKEQKICEEATRNSYYRINENRNQIKSNFEELTSIFTDRLMHKHPPERFKKYSKDDSMVSLPVPSKEVISKSDIFSCIDDRRSHRKFKNEKITLDELSYLLWATQGLSKGQKGDIYNRRTVPSGGGRHPFETYLVINNVEDVLPGVYRYSPLEHSLVFLYEPKNMRNKVVELSLDQDFVGEAPIVFFWSVVPYRSEWRYSVAAQKVILLDCGHLCQNLYISAESIGCGVCAIATYSQKMADSFLKLDGKEEFVAYLAPLGKV